MLESNLSPTVPARIVLFFGAESILIRKLVQRSINRFANDALVSLAHFEHRGA